MGRRTVKLILILDEAHERNYEALQRFLRDDPVVGRRRRWKKVKSRKTALDKQGHKCADCRNEFTHTNVPTLDHVIPFRYGATISMNHEYVCFKCNRKRDKNPLSHIIRYFGTIE
jgi:5-methylcytosine-specific restriction endonuclease McrA